MTPEERIDALEARCDRYETLLVNVVSYVARAISGSEATDEQWEEVVGMSREDWVRHVIMYAEEPDISKGPAQILPFEPRS